MPRAGLTTDIITAAAAELLDREGTDALTLSRLAGELGVQAPSLYNHVDGLDGLRRAVILAGVDELADRCRSALIGRSGPSGLRAMAHAYRDYARARPGVYPLTQIARPDDSEYHVRAGRLLDAVLALLAGFGIPESERIHAARAVRSALHGFAVLETQAGFGLEVDVDASFEWLLTGLERALGVTASEGFEPGRL